MLQTTLCICVSHNIWYSKVTLGSLSLLSILTDSTESLLSLDSIIIKAGDTQLTFSTSNATGSLYSTGTSCMTQLQKDPNLWKIQWPSQDQLFLFWIPHNMFGIHLCCRSQNIKIFSVKASTWQKIDMWSNHSCGTHNLCAANYWTKEIIYLNIYLEWHRL